MDRTCLLDGCDRNVAARGWCKMHYNRWQRHGDPLVAMRLRGSSFAEKVARHTRVTESGCREWTGHRDVYGYGRVSIDGREQFSHRAAWEHANGPIPDGMFVCHHCDNPPCCEPAHLFLGSPLDNMRDMHAKGRAVLPRSGEGTRVTITWDVADAIRRACDEGARSVDVANQHGVSAGVVASIKARKTWNPDLRRKS